MKTKTNRMKATIGLFAVLTVTVVFSIGAAPAMAGPKYVESSAVLELLQQPGLEHISDMLDIGEALLPDDGPIVDGGGWEPAFPDGGDDEPVPAEDAEDEAVDEAADEDVCEEEPAEDAGDEAVEEVPADETVEEVPVDEGTPDTIIEEAGDEADELPYTGGDSIIWLFVGGCIILAGAVSLLIRGHSTESR